MNETLKELVSNNIFTKIAVAAVNQKKQNIEGMQELVALYLAMNWIKADESTEILAYAQEKLTVSV